jgi:hypothetical protein
MVKKLPRLLLIFSLSTLTKPAAAAAAAESGVARQRGSGQRLWRVLRHVYTSTTTASDWPR